MSSPFVIVSDIIRKAYFCPHWLPFQTKPKKTISFELQKNESLNVRAVTSLQSITLQIDTQYQPLPKSKSIHIPLANHEYTQNTCCIVSIIQPLLYCESLS